MKHTEEMFVIEYIRNGGNGKKAYLAVKPNSSEKSAKVSACRLLKKPVVIDAIQRTSEKRYDESIASREYLINEAHEIGQDAFKKDKHGAAIKSVDIKAKLNHIYDETIDESATYSTLLQSININIPGISRTIDVTPKEENS
ncbi:MAG: terminase small subunit [Candidatus Hodarchaeales archaeon]|jgi:phage terminase small subunit